VPTTTNHENVDEKLSKNTNGNIYKAACNKQSNRRTFQIALRTEKHTNYYS
jgi:hypothetical protein